MLSFTTELSIIIIIPSLNSILIVPDFSVFLLSGVMQVPFSSADSSYCNKPWRTFFNETGINPEEIWFGVVSNR